ncbi:MAG TPA: hypothetical protein QGF35_00440 [Dehalococcoidia bacterium]|nr:hypothetical protein [Dehalococcoidia bacterium]
MRQQVLEGTHWFVALVDAVGQWQTPAETFDGRQYAYLVGGDAFDWLVLAERLIEETDDLVPDDEAEALLFEGRWPMEMADDEFAERLGQSKHRAHLNYLYGVLVEEALQLSVEEEVHKENFLGGVGTDQLYRDIAMSRVYGAPLAILVDEYRDTTGAVITDRIGYHEWKCFTYFLFKRRMKNQDPARMASDTRKGLAHLSRMELAVTERRHPKVERRLATEARRAAGDRAGRAQARKAGSKLL